MNDVMQDDTTLATCLPESTSINFIQNVYSHSDLMRWRESFILGDDDIPTRCLRGARARVKLSVEHLADLSDIPARHISEMENGTRPIGRQNALALSKIVQVASTLFLTKSEFYQSRGTSYVTPLEAVSEIPHKTCDKMKGSHPDGASWQGYMQGEEISTLSPSLRQILALDVARGVLTGSDASCLERLGVTQANFDYASQFFGTPYTTHILQNDVIDSKLSIMAMALPLLGLDEIVVLNLKKYAQEQKFSKEIQSVIDFLVNESKHICALWEQSTSEEQVYPRIFYEWAMQKGLIIPQKIAFYLLQNHLLGSYAMIEHAERDFALDTDSRDEKSDFTSAWQKQYEDKDIIAIFYQYLEAIVHQEDIGRENNALPIRMRNYLHYLDKNTAEKLSIPYIGGRNISRDNQQARNKDIPLLKRLYPNLPDLPRSFLKRV